MRRRVREMPEKGWTVFSEGVIKFSTSQSLHLAQRHGVQSLLRMERGALTLTPIQMMLWCNWVDWTDVLLWKLRPKALSHHRPKTRSHTHPFTQLLAIHLGTNRYLLKRAHTHTHVSSKLSMAFSQNKHALRRRCTVGKQSCFISDYRGGVWSELTVPH